MWRADRSCGRPYKASDGALPSGACVAVQFFGPCGMHQRLAPYSNDLVRPLACTNAVQCMNVLKEHAVKMRRIGRNQHAAHSSYNTQVYGTLPFYIDVRTFLYLSSIVHWNRRRTVYVNF